MTQTNVSAEMVSLVSENNTAKAIMADFAERRRFRKTTNIDRLKNLLLAKGEKIVDKEYMETFKRLQDMDYGSIVYGRNGQPTRFVWNYNLKSVGRSAFTGEDKEPIKLPEVQTPVKRGRGRPKGSKNKPKQIDRKLEAYRVILDQAASIIASARDIVKEIKSAE